MNAACGTQKHTHTKKIKTERKEQQSELQLFETFYSNVIRLGLILFGSDSLLHHQIHLYKGENK